MKNFNALAILAGFIVFYLVPGQAQINAQTCGTPDVRDPAFNNDAFQQYKESYHDRVQLRQITRIPLLPRIVRHTDGSGGMKTELLDQVLSDLNERFDGSNLEFFYCGDPAFVDVDVFYDFDRNLYADSLVTYNIPGAVNIYFINKVLNDDSFICGYASFPWTEGEYVVVKNSCAVNTSTVAHEIGHYLGLYHTHSTFNGIELADGSNCTFAGDELCDTPADPRLGTHNVTADCDYNGRERDLNNDRYRPDPANVMSYSRKACRTAFSPDQQVRMAFYLDKDRTHLACQNVVSTEPGPALSPHLRLYPNPAADILYIETGTGLSADRDQLKIVNILGQPIRTINIQQTGRNSPLPVRTEGLHPGLYTIVWNRGTKTYSKTFLKK